MDQTSLTLIGELLTVRSYNFEALQRTLKQRDREKVLDGAPWNFDNQLLFLKHVHGGEQPESIVLDKCPFWVRLYNFPLDSRTKGDVTIIARNMGEVLEVEEDDLGWDKSRRVRVLLDVTKPLRQSQKI
ncbi:Tetraacyldisaccharide 4'-kinase [Bienertia sinuspersici]